MTLTAAPRATGPAAWADALLLSFAQAGYIRAEPAILQPAEPFLDLSGEDIRKSLYLTTDAGGEELCCGRGARHATSIGAPSRLAPRGSRGLSAVRRVADPVPDFAPVRRAGAPAGRHLRS